MKRVQNAPRFQLTFETGMAYKQLSPEAKDAVYRRFHSWLCEARKRGADYWNIHPNTSGLDDDSSEILEAMTANVCEGLDSYWSRAAKDGEPSRTVSDCPTPSETANKIINQEMNELTNERENENERTPESGFIPPSVDDVRRYAQENNLQDDADAFVTYYTARDWKHKDGQPLTNFEASYRMWIYRGEQFKEKERVGKVVPANDYHQREYSGDKLEKLLGVDELYRQ